MLQPKQVIECLRSFGNRLNCCKLAADFLRLFLFSLLALVVPTLYAVDLSTTNSTCLRSFWLAVEQKQKPITLLSYGDSMADSYRSIAYCMFNQMADRLGIAGYSLINYRNALLWNLTNGAQTLAPDANWFTTHHQLPPGAGMWWETQGSPGGFFCDRAGLFYVATPGGGNMTVSISTNTGPWTPLLSISGYSPSPIGKFTNLNLSLNTYRLRVDSVSGTNIILGPQLLNTHSNGIHAAFICEPGIGLDNVTNVSLAIRTPILAALSPDLLIWHMKEDGSDTTRDRLIENELWWSNAAPNCSVLYIGSPWVSIDSNTTYTVDQNTLVRSIALAYHHAYVDCMTPAISYDFMRTNGYMADGTHPNLQGNLYLNNFAWPDIGLFALGAPMRLQVQPAGNQFNVQFQTTTNIVYHLESSTNLMVWQSVFSTNGNGLQVTRAVPALPGAQNFRLRLQPAH